MALLVVTALFAGILPMGNPTVSKAAVTDRAGYGLNNPRTDAAGVTTWDCVWFGNYWQEDINGDGKADKNDQKTPIKWRVLSVDGDDAFLLADKNLDCQRYNDTYTRVTWETCTMRSWLNGYGAGENKEGKDYSDNNFLDNAFSKAEQSAIKTTNVVNNDNPEYGTEGGNDTIDQVYLLSIDEVTNPAYGFSSDYSKYDEGRRAKNTEYAKTQGAYTNTSEEYAGNGVWLLRSPGHSSYSAFGVDLYGRVPWNGYDVLNCNSAARPALHLNLSSASSWSYAGTVTSNGGESGTVTPTPSAKPSETEKPGIGPTAPGIPSASDSPTTAPTDTATPPSAKPSETAKPGFGPAAPTTPSASDSPTASVAPVLQPPVSPAVTNTVKAPAIKLKQKKQAVTVSWKRVMGAAGYQICYSTSKKWKNKKQKQTRQTKLTVKKLKRKKTYYFRVRAYRINGTSKIYGAWSKTKKITIKK